MLDLSGFTTTLQKDDDDNHILDFPPNLLETMGWEEGDTLDIQSSYGRIVISKVTGPGAGDGAGPD